MLLHLPKELISLIFSRLDGRSLVLCQLLSRQCSEVILSNLQLTYRINLFSANLTDNPNHHAPLIERSESLKSFIRARDEGNWSDPVILDSLFEVAHSDTFRSLRAFSGVLAFSTDGHFCCIDASEVASGGRVRRWEFVAKFPDAAFIFPYPPQNLLLVKERQPGQLIFRPLSLETGQDHPEALRRSLPPIPCPAETIYNDYYVCDEYLRVWVDLGTVDCTLGEITVCNWMTGTVCRTIRGSYTCATLLDASYVICCRVEAGASATMDFRLDVYPIHENSSDQPIITFEYPPIHGTMLPNIPAPPCEFLMSASLSSTRTRRKHRPFAANAEDSIMSFCTSSVRNRHGDEYGDHPWQMTSVFLVSSILSQVRAVEASPDWDRKTPVRVPPGGWKHCTIPMWDDHVVYMHGSRMIVQRDPSNVFTILDFDRKSVAGKDLGIPSSLKAPGVQDIPWVDKKQVDEAMLLPRVHSFMLDAPGRSIGDIEFDEDTITFLLVEDSKRMLYIYRQKGADPL